MTDADPAQPPPRFRALLRPNRSLTPVGFKVLMGFVIFVNVAVGVAFWMLGAWPVFGFCGLDVAAIYWAFKINYREAGLTEQIEIGHADLSLVRTHRLARQGVVGRDISVAGGAPRAGRRAAGPASGGAHERLTGGVSRNRSRHVRVAAPWSPNAPSPSISITCRA